MEISKAGTNERSPGGLSLPNQNTLLINIIWYYLKIYTKSTMTFNWFFFVNCNINSKWTSIIEIWHHPPSPLQVTPYHPHNSVNLPNHLLHITLHLLLGGDCLGHLYIHHTAMVTTVSLAWSHFNIWMSLMISSPIVSLTSYH